LVFVFSGIYGTQGVGTTTTTPGGRYVPSTWYDRNGNLWLFGGGFTGLSFSFRFALTPEIGNRLSQ